MNVRSLFTVSSAHITYSKHFLLVHKRLKGETVFFLNSKPHFPMNFSSVLQSQFDVSLTLNDVVEKERFHFNATSLQDTTSMRF